MVSHKQLCIIIVLVIYGISMAAADRMKLEDIDPRMEKYFTEDVKSKLKEERARKASSDLDDDLTMSDEDLKKAKSPLMYPNFECPKEKVKFEDIQDDEMVNNNYMKIMYRYKRFLLYVTATWCDYCCQHNDELRKLKILLKDRTIDGEEIPIVIVHSNNAVDAVRELKITYFKVPTLFFVQNKNFIQYSSFFRAPNIFRFLNNIINPVIELNTVQEVEDFLDTTKEVDEDNEFLVGTKPHVEHAFFDFFYKNRMIGFFADKDEYAAEYSSFMNYAEKISHRNDLRVGLVVNRELIKHFKKVYEGSWFNTHSWNSVVLKRAEKTMFLDLSLLSEHLEVFMLYNTVPLAEELSINNTAIIAKISTPIMLFFIDTSFILENYVTQLKFIEMIAKDYVGKYVFMYLDGNTKTKTKEMFGLKKDMQTPNFVIMYISSNKFKNTPESFAYCDIFIHKFLNKNLGTKYSGELDAIRDKNIKSFDDKIVANLKSTTKIQISNYVQTLANKKYDFIVFVIDSDYDEKSEITSKYINKLCERLKALGIKSTLVATFDINENGIQNKFEGIPLINGKIFFVPSKSKKPVLYNEKVSTLRLLKFIEKLAEIKIRLPELPHLEPELHEDYYLKKSVLEGYEENFDKSELQLDDIIDMDFSTLSSKKDKDITDL